MFSLVRKSFFRKAVITVFILPLMFAGGSLVGGIAQDSVGSVESFDISRQEFLQAFQRLTEEYRRRYGVSEVSRELGALIGREARDQLVTDYLMRAAVDEKEINAPPEAVAREIRDYDEFKDDSGEFSFAIYADYVPDRYRFEAQVRRSLGREPIFAMMESYPLQPVRERLAAFRRQHRVVDETSVTVTAAYNIPDTDIRAYYDNNQRQYLLRESADFEYVTVSFDAFAETRVSVTEDEIELAYEDYKSELQDRRRLKVSHIYIADDSEDGFIRAEELAQQAIDGADFATLAREHSDDAGTALNGGSFGFVALGDLPEAMDDALAQLNEGEVSEPVEVDGGFSVMRLDEIALPPIAELNEVRDEITSRARRDKAYDSFQDEIDKLREIAFRQVGSLLSLATLANSTVQQATGVLRRSAPGAAPEPFATREVREEAFAEEIVGGSGETGAIALENESYLFVRAMRYQPRRTKPLEEVSGEIAARLNAREQVEDMFNEMEETGIPPAILDTVSWSAPYTLSLTAEEDDRQDDAPINEEERQKLLDTDQVFNADLTGGLPAYAMTPGEGKIRVFRIRNVINNEPLDEDFVLIDELISPPERNLAGAGYLEILSSRFNVRFDVPEDIDQTQ